MPINPLQPPINYLGMIPQVNIGQQFADIGQIIADRQKQEGQENAKIQFSNDLQNARSVGTQSAWLDMIAKYPQFREAFGDVRKGVGEERVKNEFNQGFEISAALESGNPEVAKQRLMTIIEAKTRSGESAGTYQSALDAIEKGDIQRAQSGVNQILAITDPDRYEKSVKALEEQRASQRLSELHPSKLLEAQSTAQKSAVAAKFAESDAAIDLKKKGWDITKIQEDIKIAKQNASIAALNAQISREGNQIKRAENQIKLGEFMQKRDEAVRGKVAEASTAAAHADNLLNTTEKALNMAITGRDKSGQPIGFTDTIKSATGPFDVRMPTLNRGVADFEEVINTLGSQVIMSRLGEMKGVLSDKDIATLQSSLQSLSLRQSPKQLVDNLIEVQRLTQKARKTTMDKFGAPATLSVPDTPAAQPGSAEIDNLLKKYGGGR